MRLQTFDRKLPGLSTASYLLLPFIYVIFRTALIGAVTPERSPHDCVAGPFEGCGFIFDEAHYIPAVRRMLLWEAVNLEHPPLSKWVITLGIMLFGDNPWGWRAPMVLFSASTIAVAGLLARRLGGEKYVIPA